MQLPNKIKLGAVVCCLLLLVGVPERGLSQTVSRTYHSQKSGDWRSPGMWREADGTEGVPTLDDGVIIKDAHTVTLDATISLSRVEIQGNGLLQILSTGDLTVYGQVIVDRNGVSPESDKGLSVSNGGNIRVRHAAEKEDITPCTIPSSLSLTVSDISTDGFLVSWDISDNTCVQSYEVNVSQGGTTVKVLEIYQNSVTVTGLVQGTDYDVVVRAISEGNELLKESQSVTTQTIVEETPEGVTVFGERKLWHRIGVAINTSLLLNETSTYNPFLNYRYEVTFTHVVSQATYVVPGHYSGRLDNADGGTGGGLFRCYFSPDRSGQWNYKISFRKGTNIAVTANMTGDPGHTLDTKSGSFTVSPSDKTGRDHRYHGRLEYVGERYLRYSGSKEYFIKGGADSPENFLAYDEFDNTPNNMGSNNLRNRKSWVAHAPDYESKDEAYLWEISGEKRGQEILGAVNYLAKKGMNVFSFIPMNINGDDKNVFPYISDTVYTRMDLSKLDQWERVFSYADSKGMYLHFKLFEIENDSLLNDGNLEIERKLYFREMVSRFGHHLALNWNLGEENDLSISKVKDDGEYIKGLDPYDHLIVVHTGRTSGAHNGRYGQLTGSQSVLTGASMQINQYQVHKQTKIWIDNAIAAGKPWVVANDEQASGVPSDTGGNLQVDNISYDKDDVRKEVLWGNLMAGGAGVEYYFGDEDLSNEDFGTRSDTWDWTQHALTFFRENLPFWDMANENGLVGNMDDDNSVYCFAKVGDIYVVYLPNGGTRSLTTSNDVFEVSWYDPRNGRFQTAPEEINSNGTLSLNAPDGVNDWVALVKRRDYVFARPLTLELVSARTGNTTGNISVLGTITDGTVVNLSDLPVGNVSLQAKIGVDVDNIVFDMDNGTYTYTDTGAPYTLYGETGSSIDVWPVTEGSYSLKVTAYKGGETVGERTFDITILDCASLVTYYRDADGDGVGVATDVQRLCSTAPAPSGYVTVSGDCDDSDASVSSDCGPVSGTSGGDILFIVGNLTLGTGDATVKSRLENELNSTVTVVRDNVATTADANGKDLVIISSTVSSSAVNTGFNTLAVPVMNWEQAFQDDLHMTKNNSTTDRGTATGQDQLVLDSDVRAVPFQEGLSSPVTIYNTIKNVLWGVPQGNAIKVASYTSGRYSLFAYELGDPMRDGQTAPEKRVSFFLQDVESEFLTADGWRLFDNTVKWAGGFTDGVPAGDSLAPVFQVAAALSVVDSTSSTVTVSWPGASDASGIFGYEISRDGVPVVTVQDTVYTLTGLLPDRTYTVGVRARDNTDLFSAQLSATVRTADGPAPSGGEVLFVVGENPLGAGDAAFKGILETLGFNVGLQVVSQGGSPDATEAVGKDLVVISSTIVSGDVGSAFRDVTVPVMVWEKDLLDDMGMNSGNRFEQPGITTLSRVVDGRNAPFLENTGAGDDITVYTTGGRVIGGVATGNPIRILDATGTAGDQYAMYAYDTGDGMDGMVAPSKRVALFLNDTEAAELTTDGGTLVRNAILWAAGQPNVLTDTQAPTFGQGAALTATAVGANSLSLGWTMADDDIGVTFYNIYVSDTLVATAGGTATGFDLGGLTASTQYQLKVRAGDAAGNLSTALSASATTAVADTSSVPREVLFVVEDPANPNGAESAIKARLEGDNYTVVLQDDNGVSAANATGMDLVIISSTVVSTNVNTAFSDVAIPVINWEKSLLDEMYLAGGQGNIDDSLSLDINISAEGHPLAAGLSGRVTVYGNTVTSETTSNGRFLTGSPSASAIDVASSGGNSVYFAYDKDAAMVGGIPAPERRVAFFLWDVEAAHFTVQGWQLFDAAVAWAVGNTSVAVPDTEAPLFGAGASLTAPTVTSSSVTLDWDVATDSGSGLGTYRLFQNGGQLVEQSGTGYTATGLSDSTVYRFSVVAVDRDGNLSDSLSVDVTTLAYDSLTAKDILFVVGNTALNNGDAAIRTRLERDYNVEVRAGNGIQASDGFDKDLVIISSTVSSSDVGGTFTDLPVSVINWEKGLLDDLHLSTTQGNVYDDLTLDISMDTSITGHPLSAGLSGTVTVYGNSVLDEISSNGTMLAGTPGSNAIAVASSGGNGVYFAYEKGDEMATTGFMAPEKRIAFFLWDVEAAHLTTEGWQLFDAAVAWSVGQGVTTTIPDTVPPVFPTGASMVATNITDRGADLSWTSATDQIGVTGYRVYRNGNLETELLSNTYNARILSDSTEYTYSVIAEDAIGNLSDTLSVTFTTLMTDTTSTPTIKEVLFVVGNTTLGTGDQAVKDRLENELFCNVTLLDDDAVSSGAQLAGKDLVVISSTVSSFKVGTAYTSTTLPVVNWEKDLLDDLNMNGGVRGEVTVTDLTIETDPDNGPFLQGVGSGSTLTVYSSSGKMSWSEPSGDVILIGTFASAPTGRHIFYAYDTGGAMASGTAPGRRVALFLHDVEAASLNTDGWILFDNSIDWALER